MSLDQKQIVVNATPLLSNRTGVGQVIHEVCSWLDRCGLSPDLFTPLKTFSSVAEMENASRQVALVMALKKRFGGLGIKKVLRSFYSRSTSAKNPVYDLYWEPNYIPLDGIRSKRTVVTVYDMSVQDHPEWHPEDRVRFHEQNFFPNIGRADWVTTISEFSRQRFLALQTDIPAERVRVIPCGVDRNLFQVFDSNRVELFRKKYRLPEEFLLFVGTFEPRKNLLHLLNAYERLPPSLRNRFPLVLVGDAGWENKEIEKRVASLGRAVRKMGYMNSRAELALLYNAASVFVFPSLYEGFGIPPLEAMACGTPVCLSSIPVFHEIYGDGNVCYGDPLDARSFSESLQSLLEDSPYQKRLIKNGLEAVRFYTWERAFGGYLDVFRELMD